MTSAHSFKSIIALGIAIVSLLGYGFISAWDPAPANPPANNVPPPINKATSTNSTQWGYGALGFDYLVAYRGVLVKGSSTIESDAPTMMYKDTNGRDFWSHVNSNIFYLIADRNDDGVWTGELPAPLMISASTTQAGDFARFSSQVRAKEYCDENGANCTTPGSNDGTITINGVCMEPRVMYTCNWNWSGSGNDNSTSYTPCSEQGRTEVNRFVVMGQCAAHARDGREAVYAVVRLGRDGRPGTSDDITSIDAAQAIISGTAERAEACDMLLPGGKVFTYSDSSFGSGIVAGARFNGTNWSYVNPASGRYLTSISCNITGATDLTYEWRTSGWSCNAPTPQICEVEYGTSVRTVQCVDSQDNVVPDSNCSAAGPKPTTSNGSCTRHGGNSSSC